jgi:hypothetical protein
MAMNVGRLEAGIPPAKMPNDAMNDLSEALDLNRQRIGISFGWAFSSSEALRADWRRRRGTLSLS